MSTLTIRLPDDKHERLKALARSNSISINKQMDELATVRVERAGTQMQFSQPHVGIALLAEAVSWCTSHISSLAKNRPQWARLPRLN